MNNHHTSLRAEIEALEEYVARRKDVAGYVFERYPGMRGEFLRARFAETAKRRAAALERLAELKLQINDLPAVPPEQSQYLQFITQGGLT